MTDDGGWFAITRPTYTVPTLAEIATRDNGLTAVSTFSGCGGSTTGLRMAGWRVPYAVEFIPAAADTYAVNYPTTYVDRRDIRTVDPADILDRVGVDVGELDLFEGSPPCSSFAAINTSAAGRYGQGKNKHYSEGVYQVTDDLFDEWLRLIDGLRPRAVLAENVPGLLGDNSATYYRTILDRLDRGGYAVDAAIYNAMHYGAATSRRRLVIRAIRRDVAPLPPRPRRTAGVGASLGDALATLPVPNPAEELAHADAAPYAVGKAWHALRLGAYDAKYRQVVRCNPDEPLPGVTAVGESRGSANPMHPHECRKFTATELAWAFGFPPDYRFTGDPGQRYERIARCVAPPLYNAHGAALRDALNGRP